MSARGWGLARAGASLAAAGLAGAVGAAAGRRWKPRPVERPVVPVTPDPSIPGLDVGPYRWERELVRIAHRGKRIVSQVTRPVGDGPWPTAVFAHGAGTGNHTAFAEHTAILARHGVASVVGDKDLSSYSTLYRDYLAQAGAYRGLALWARRQEWSGQVGFYGESEGAWMVPPACEGFDFVVLASAPGVSPRQQAIYAAESFLARADAPYGMRDAALRMTTAKMPGNTLQYGDFDVHPYQRRMTMPVLALWGTGDDSMPMTQAARLLIDDLKAAGNDAVTIRFYPVVNHGLRQGSYDALSEGIYRDIARWINGFPESSRTSPRVAGASPRQDFDVPNPRVGTGLASLDAQAAFGLASLALMVLPVAGSLVTRLAGRKLQPLPHETRSAYALLAFSSILSNGVYLADLVHVAKVAASRSGPRQSVKILHWVVRGTGILCIAAVGLAAYRFRIVSRHEDESWSSIRALHPGQLLRVSLVAAGSMGLRMFSAYWGSPLPGTRLGRSSRAARRLFSGSGQ